MASLTMNFGINIPLDRVNPPCEFQTPEAVQAIAAALERSHAASGHLTDHPAPSADWLHNDPTGHDALDPFTGLAFIAASTKRIRLQTSVVILPYRNPFLTAKAAATLQVLSGGRLVLGVGVGYQKGEFAALGAPFEERGALTDEALETIRLAWAGGTVVKRGRRFDAAGNEPRPAPSPPPPIWVGGGSRKAVERAARWGDGWAPFLARPTNDPYVDQSSVKSFAELGEKIGLLRELREQHGKPPVCDVILAPPFFPKAHTREEADAYCDKVAELQALGVTWMTVTLRARTLQAWFDTLAWFSEEIMARFGGAAA
jgi:probable F420-dependent oxidoreductase